MTQKPNRLAPDSDPPGPTTADAARTEFEQLWDSAVPLDEVLERLRVRLEAGR